VTTRLSPIERAAAPLLMTATLSVDTPGVGFTDITREITSFLRECRCSHGALTVFLRHTSASLTIQENADPDVQTDLTDALERLAPQHAGYIHSTEGPDDMPAHIKAMLTGCSLTIPVKDGVLKLGTWQGIYVVEHRRAPHTREVVLQFIGSAR
jgi:secondary thiamine-phosphate synthase enzyme